MTSKTTKLGVFQASQSPMIEHGASWTQKHIENSKHIKEMICTPMASAGNIDNAGISKFNPSIRSSINE